MLNRGAGPLLVEYVAYRDDRARVEPANPIKKDKDERSVNIEGIGKFDKNAYDECSLANPSSLNGRNKTRLPGSVTAGILDILVSHADAVHYMIERFLGISVSDQLFASMLQQFRKQEGYLYREVSTSNLPYALLYMAGNQHTSGCPSKEASPFTRALAKSKHFELSKKWIKRKPNSNAQLHFFVTDHVIKRSTSGNEQTMSLVIEEDASGKKEHLLHVAVSLEIDYFRNTLGKRMRLRDIAQEEFSAL